MSLDTKSVIIRDVSDYTFKFKNLLDNTDTLIWKNCKNIKIYISNKINKLVLNNCENVLLSTSYFISGIELFKSSSITIDVNDDHSISCIDLYNSSLKININKNVKIPHIINEKSTVSINKI